MKPILQRAKTPEQKAARRQHILDAAADIIMRSSFDELSLIEIAEAVGITKAALYRYFRNKETLFLALYEDSLTLLISDAAKLTQETNSSTSSDLTELLLRHRLFCHLTAILNSVLERNLTVEEAIEFKKRLLVSMSAFAQFISTRLNIAPHYALQLMFHIQQAIIGCWLTCNPLGTMKEALKDRSLKIFELDFETSLREHLQLIVIGFEAGQSNRKNKE